MILNGDAIKAQIFFKSSSPIIFLVEGEVFTPRMEVPLIRNIKNRLKMGLLGLSNLKVYKLMFALESSLNEKIWTAGFSVILNSNNCQLINLLVNSLQEGTALIIFLSSPLASETKILKPYPSSNQYLLYNNSTMTTMQINEK